MKNDTSGASSAPVRPAVASPANAKKAAPKRAAAKQAKSLTTPAEQEIRSWISTVRFKRKVIGGLDEKDVWKKIGELDALYAKALAAERLRCDTMVAHWRKMAECSQAKSVETQIRVSKAGASNPRAHQQGGELDG